MQENFPVKGVCALDLHLLEKRSLRADVLVSHNIINDTNEGGNINCFYNALLEEGNFGYKQLRQYN